MCAATAVGWPEAAQAHRGGTGAPPAEPAEHVVVLVNACAAPLAATGLWRCVGVQTSGRCPGPLRNLEPERASRHGRAQALRRGSCGCDGPAAPRLPVCARRCRPLPALQGPPVLQAQSGSSRGRPGRARLLHPRSLAARCCCSASGGRSVLLPVSRHWVTRSNPGGTAVSTVSHPMISQCPPCAGMMMIFPGVVAHPAPNLLELRVGPRCFQCRPRSYTQAKLATGGGPRWFQCRPRSYTVGAQTVACLTEMAC